MLVTLRLGMALLQAMPAAIPANDLRTRADTEWIVTAAATALPRGSIRAVGGVASNSSDAGTRSFYAGERGPLDVVARAFGLSLDTSTAASPPPPCASDTTAPPDRRGYRVERVRVTARNIEPPPGNPYWVHYVVELTRTCRRGSEKLYVGSEVRFDAKPDARLSYQWAVGNVRQDPDPPPSRAPTFSERHGALGGGVTKVVLFGALAFPVLGLLVGAVGGQRGLAGLLGVWSLTGLALAMLAGGPGFIAWLVLFVPPALAYVVGAARQESQEAPEAAPPAFGRATLLLAAAYALCFVLFWGMQW